MVSLESSSIPKELNNLDIQVKFTKNNIVLIIKIIIAVLLLIVSLINGDVDLAIKALGTIVG